MAFTDNDGFQYMGMVQMGRTWPHVQKLDDLSIAFPKEYSAKIIRAIEII